MNTEDNNLDEIISDPELKERLRTLVLERINVMPNTLRVAVGSQEITKEDILRHVQEGDEIGKQMMELELTFLRDLASGAVYGGD